MGGTSSIPIVILAANWGGRDVTQRVAKLYKKHDGIFTATTKELGDPLPNKKKFLHVIYIMGGIVNSLVLDENHKSTPIPSVHIVSAYYGSADVTSLVQKLGNEFKVTDKNLGNLNPGTDKNFTIAYVKDGQLKTIVAKEKDKIKLT